MVKLSHREKWYAGMRAKLEKEFGYVDATDDDVSKFMAAKARQVKNRKGGYFTKMKGTEELRQLSKKAADKRWKS